MSKEGPLQNCGYLVKEGETAIVDHRRAAINCSLPTRHGGERAAEVPANVGFDGSSAAFFTLVRGHVMQGTFGDPVYGGNEGFVGWDLIGYPGVRTVVTPAEQKLLTPPTRVRSSAGTTCTSRMPVTAFTGPFDPMITQR